MRERGIKRLATTRPTTLTRVALFTDQRQLVLWSHSSLPCKGYMLSGGPDATRLRTWLPGVVLQLQL